MSGKTVNGHYFFSTHTPLYQMHDWLGPVYILGKQQLPEDNLRFYYKGIQSILLHLRRSNERIRKKQF